MARSVVRPPLLPSLLDRLLDDEPGTSTEADWVHSQSVRELKISVQRDIERLLNTRSQPHDHLDEEDELSQSLYVYGLPDLTSISHGNADDAERLRLSVEKAIRCFEPRLMDVYVRLSATGDANDRRIRFVIDAQLKMQPNPEPVQFDTVVRTTTGEYQVTAEA